MEPSNSCGSLLCLLLDDILVEESVFITAFDLHGPEGASTNSCVRGTARSDICSILETVSVDIIEWFMLSVFFISANYKFTVENSGVCKLHKILKKVSHLV
jgi:hypothetical protein